jgi:alcohol dehydrogenase (cytochrome c)
MVLREEARKYVLLASTLLSLGLLRHSEPAAAGAAEGKSLFDASSGKVRWKRQWPTPLVAGVTVSAGGVLFTGDLADNFVALDTKSGKTLYTFNTGGSVGGGVLSYEVKGKQYVAAMSGAVSGFFGGSGPAAVVVFALP